MTPIKLIIHNFCGIGHVEVNFDASGVTRICGTTGLGKSTIPDALIWAQYGLTKNKTKGDEVINRFEKSCYVSVEYDDIKIVRHRKDKKFKNDVMVYTKVNGIFDDDAEESIGAKKYTIQGDNKATQKNIDELLGMSFEVYVKVISFGQGDEKSGRWGELTNVQLRQAMTEAVGLEEIDVNKKKISSYRDEVKEALSKTISSPIPLQSRLDVLSFKRNTIQSGISRQQEEALRCDSANADRLRYINVQVASTNADIERLTALEVMSKDDFDAKVKEFDEYHVKLREVKGLLGEAQQQYMKANTADSQMDTKLRAATTAFKGLESQLVNIESKIGTNCHECGKTYTAEDMGSSVRILQDKIEDARVVVGEHSEGYALTSDELTSAKTGVEYIQKAIRDLETLLGAYNNVVNEYNAGAAQKALIAPAKEKLIALESELSHTNSYVSKKYDSSNDKKEIKKLEIEINTAQEELDGVLSEIDNKETLIRSLDDVIETLEVSKGLIIDSVTVPLNENIQKCVKAIMPDMDIEFQTMTKLKSGEFREKFCIKAVLSEGAKGYKSFSGGQRAVCDLSISLGFAMTIREQQANLPNLMFVDEGLNAMDVDLAAKAIKVLLDMEISNLYLMSHAQDLQALIPQTIELTRIAGKTFIKEEL